MPSVKVQAMKSTYWERRQGLDGLYADTLKNMAARMGCRTVRQMNKGQLADYIIRNENNVDDSNFIDACIKEGRWRSGKLLYLGD